MKRIVAIILLLTVITGAVGCGANKEETEDQVIKVGVVGESNEMWDNVIATLKEEGITVELVKFSDYSTPNQALANGEIDLNAFQHHAYFEQEIENYGYELTAIGDTFISAMNIYSKTLTDISEVKQGDKVAVPNDATNEGRALKILEAAGLLTLDPAAGDSPEVSDITDNPLELQLVEVDAANVYALLSDVAIGVINCNYALDSGLNPAEDALFEDSVTVYSGDSYINLIAARTEDKENELYQKVVEAYQSDGVKEVFQTVFKGAYLPGWE